MGKPEGKRGLDRSRSRDDRFVPGIRPKGKGKGKGKYVPEGNKSDSDPSDSEPHRNEPSPPKAAASAWIGFPLPNRIPLPPGIQGKGRLNLARSTSLKHSDTDSDNDVPNTSEPSPPGTVPWTPIQWPRYYRENSNRCQCSTCSRGTAGAPRFMWCDPGEAAARDQQFLGSTLFS